MNIFLNTKGSGPLLMGLERWDEPFSKLWRSYPFSEVNFLTYVSREKAEYGGEVRVITDNPTTFILLPRQGVIVYLSTKYPSLREALNAASREEAKGYTTYSP